MGCGCASSTGSPATTEEGGHNYARQKGEDVECWANNTEADDNKQADVKPAVIANATVSADCDMKVDETFKLTPYTDATRDDQHLENAKNPIKWKLHSKPPDPPASSPTPTAPGTEDLTTPDKNDVDANALPDATVPGLTFDKDTGHLSGTFPDDQEGKTIDFYVSAIDADNKTVDTKKYSVLARKCKPGSDAIQIINPLPGSYVSGVFGEQRATPTPHVHKGVDLSVGPGISHDVVAAADGTVLQTPFVGNGYGNGVLMQHKVGDQTFETLYAHLSQSYVHDGDKIAAGTAIGKEGNTGCGSCPIHLHFELHMGGKAVDPMQYMTGTTQVKTTSRGDPTPIPVGSKVAGKKQAITADDVRHKTEKKCDPPRNQTARAVKAKQPPAAYIPADGTWLTLEQLQAIMPGAGDTATEFIGPLNDAIKQYGIGKQEGAMWLGQIAVECNQLKWPKERTGYSLSRARQVWPSRDFAGVADNPQSILNYVYGGRNGNNQPGDGYKYVGRGCIQVTGKGNYAACAAATGFDCVNHPEILEQPHEAAISAGWYWTSRGCQAKAIAGDIVGVTKLVNGGNKALAERKAFWERAKTVLGV